MVWFHNLLLFNFNMIAPDDEGERGARGILVVNGLEAKEVVDLKSST